MALDGTAVDGTDAAPTTSYQQFTQNKNYRIALLKSDVPAFNLLHRQYRKEFPDRPLDLTHARLNSIELLGADLAGANLEKANLQNSQLLEVSFNGANLTRAHLEHATLDGVDLTGATLDGTFLQFSKFINVIGALYISPEEITERTEKTGQFELRKIDFDVFDNAMLLVDRGEEGVFLKRDDLWGKSEDVFARWHDYTGRAEGADKGKIMQKAPHRKAVMLPLLVEKLQEADTRCQEQITAGKNFVEFSNAANTLETLKAQYGAEYPELFAPKPSVDATSANCTFAPRTAAAAPPL